MLKTVRQYLPVPLPKKDKFRNKFNITYDKFGDLAYLEKLIIKEVNALIQRGNLTESDLI